MAKRKREPRKLLDQQMPLLVIAGASIVLVGMLALQMIRKNDTEHYYTVKHWSAGTAQAFFNNCVASSTRAGSSVTSHAAKAYCGCTVNALQDIYVIDQELSQMEERAAQEGFPANVISVIRTCAKQSGVPLNTRPSGSPSANLGKLDPSPAAKSS